MYFIYILKSLRYCKSYVGCTDNLERRIIEHNSGKMMFTKKYKPWKIIYTEKYFTLSEAKKKNIFSNRDQVVV